MKAITKEKYGGPEVLTLKEIERPETKPEHILVKVKANAVNPADWHIMRGEPKLARLSFGLFKPKDKVLGADFSGVVEDASNSKRFKQDDRVYGESLKGGAFAEFNLVEETSCALIPEGLSFEEMAASPIAGLTALQALITHGKLKKGESVLVNGASGGVGHFAIQIAKAYGAEVIGVCSSRNVSFVDSLGADDVIAYDKDSIHKHNKKYDLVLDCHGNLTHGDHKRMGKRSVVIGFTTLTHMLGVMLTNIVKRHPIQVFTAKANTRDLNTLAELMKERKVKVQIDKQFNFEDTAKAIAYIEKMRTRGKVVMTMA